MANQLVEFQLTSKAHSCSVMLVPSLRTLANSLLNVASSLGSLPALAVRICGLYTASLAASRGSTLGSLALVNAAAMLCMPVPRSMAGAGAVSFIFSPLLNQHFNGHSVYRL